MDYSNTKKYILISITQPSPPIDLIYPEHSDKKKKLKTDPKCSQAEHFPNKVLFSNKKLCEKHMDWILQPSDDLKSCKLE